MSEKLPNTKVEENIGLGSSILFWGAKDVIKFVGTMVISVFSLGIYPAIKLCKKTK